MCNHLTHSVRICQVGQRSKRCFKKYGELPEKEAKATPWDKLCVNLIGPYKIRQRGKKKPLVCKCCTMIDPATGWFEIAQCNDKRSITIANIVEQEWLAIYPWPTQLIFDRGSEFMGHVFQDMVANDYGIKKKPIST